MNLVYLTGVFVLYDDATTRIHLLYMPAKELRHGLYGIYYHGERLIVRPT